MQPDKIEQTELLDPNKELADLRQKYADLEKRNKELEARILEAEKSNGKDKLTGLDNRERFDEEIERAVNIAIRTGQPLSLILGDLDHFKSVNDERGHLAGDAALQTVSSVIKDEARETDRICRYGGEEFITILPNLSLENAIGVSERFRRRITASPVKFNNEQFSVTTSMGVSSFIETTPDIRRSPSEIKDIIHNLIGNADKAMYTAKKAGRNKTGFLNSEGKFAVLEESPTSPSKMIAVNKGS